MTWSQYLRSTSPQTIHPAGGHGCQLSSLRSAGTQVQPQSRSCFHNEEQFSCTVCVHITAELVSNSSFIQCCTLYNLTGILAWLKPRLIQLYLLGLDSMSSSIKPSRSIQHSAVDFSFQPQAYCLLKHSRMFHVRYLPLALNLQKQY
jgi:hypothetical protein